MAELINDSILQTTKKMVNLVPEDDSFDLDIITDINSVFTVLEQLGVGPEGGFTITSAEETWTDYIPANSKNINAIRTYMALKVRLMFDPPTTSFVLEAISNQIQELEWRLNAQVERG